MEYIPHPQNIVRNNKRNNQRREDAAVHKDNSNQSPNPGVPSSQDSSTTERTRTQRINNARRNKGKMATEAQELIKQRWTDPPKEGIARPNVDIEPFRLFAAAPAMGSPTADLTGSPSTLGSGGVCTATGSPVSVERTATTTTKLTPAGSD